MEITSPQADSTFPCQADIDITAEAYDNSGNSNTSNSIRFIVDEPGTLSGRNNNFLSLYPKPVSGELILTAGEENS